MRKLALVLVVAAACGKSEKSEKASSPAPAATPIDVAGVNALVPAELKEKLVFEQRDIVEEGGRSNVTYTMAAPKGWEQSMKMMANIKPKSDSDLGFMTSLHVGSNCDGDCVPKDWARTSDKVDFAQFKDGKVIKEEHNVNSRLLIAEKGDSTYVVYAWWADGARRYHSCMASLEAQAKGSAAAFAKACQAVNVKGEN